MKRWGNEAEIERGVRGAVGQLRGLERIVIEGYYFDGRSLGQLAEREGISLNRMVLAQRQAFRALRTALAPLVARLYGIGAASVAGCPICAAPWREDAEAIIDGKSPATTWGQIIARLERATGFRARSPQTLLAHQRKHRIFIEERSADAGAESARGTCAEAFYLHRTEVASGDAVEAAGASGGRCLPNVDVDGAADAGGAG